MTSTRSVQFDNVPNTHREHPPQDEDEHFPEDWDAAQEMDPEAEEGEFVQFMSQIRGRDVDAMRNEIDEELKILHKQKKAAMRDSEDITQQMISQIQVSNVLPYQL
jgi:DNA excision repair protein ERCC-5